MRQRRGMADELQWLGLTELQAALLRLVMQVHEVLQSDLVSATSSSAPAVSTALAALERLHLVRRLRGQRPMLVFLAVDADQVIDELRQQALTRDQRHADAAAVFHRDLVVAVQRREERGQPVHELHMGSGDEPYKCTSTYDQVVQAGQARPYPQARRRARLIVPATDIHPVNVLRMAHHGSEIRVASGLPALLIVDGARLAVLVSTPQGLRVGWSRDALHVAAAQDLFERWWAAAEPFHVKERVPFDESNVIVEEWDEEIAREMPREWEAERAALRREVQWRGDAGWDPGEHLQEGAG